MPSDRSGPLGKQYNSNEAAHLASDIVIYTWNTHVHVYSMYMYTCTHHLLLHSYYIKIHSDRAMLEVCVCSLPEWSMAYLQSLVGSQYHG